MGSEIIHHLQNEIEHSMVPDSILFYNGLCLYIILYTMGDKLCKGFEPKNRPFHCISYGIFHFKPCGFKILRIIVIIDCSHKIINCTFSFSE